MDPKTLKVGDRITHPDFNEGEILHVGDPVEQFGVVIMWDRQGDDTWQVDDNRWEQVLLA